MDNLSPKEEPKCKTNLPQIVGSLSSLMNIPQEEAIPMSGDHREICRFSPMDERFLAVQRAIERLVALEPASAVRGSTTNAEGM